MIRPLSIMRNLLSQRRIGAVALVLLVHAVAIDTLHRHAFAADRHTSAAVTAPADSGTSSNHEPGGCPACQIQHNSVADLARVSEPFAVETTPAVLATERLQAILRSGDTSPPDRAPAPNW